MPATAPDEFCELVPVASAAFAKVTAQVTSRGEPMSLVNIELHGTVVAHLQQQRLAVILILYVNALHDLESLQRLFAKGDQNLFSISHSWFLPWRGRRYALC
jgi:hypothetical protein